MSKVVQVYKVWFDGDDESTADSFNAFDPETAAEWFCEDHADELNDEYSVNVKSPDGTVYGVTVEVVRKARFVVSDVKSN